MITTLKQRTLQGFVCALAGSLSIACGSDDSSPSSSCGTEAAPTLLPLRDVSPARGTSVANAAIIHRFTVVGIDAFFQAEMMLAPTHTAGEAIPHQIQITPRVMGDDVTYEFSPIKWSTAPGHVVIQDSSTALYKTTSGCVYEFPTPLFEYELVP